MTQKRRIRVPYSVARQLCDEREPIEHDERQRPFVNEVSTMIGNLDLRPVVTTGYRREAYVGRDADLGLRVTIDHRIHGRDRDFELVHRPDCTDEYVRRTAFQVLPERSSIRPGSPIHHAYPRETGSAPLVPPDRDLSPAPSSAADLIKSGRK